MNHPKVSIIILNWNGVEDTIECLESLKKVTYPNYEVIVVDNGSAGNDAEVLRGEFGDYIHIIENDKNYGFAEGNNIGMRHVLDNSSPEYILLLNNDTVVDSEFLTQLVEVAESNPKIGAVGPKTYYYSQPDRIQLVWNKVDLWRGRVFLAGEGEIDRGQHDEIRETDYVPGSCLLAKQETIRRVGFLDASYFGYWEETDFCQRAKGAGYRLVYCPQAKIWHKVSRSAKKVTGYSEYYMTRNRFWFMKRYATRRQFAFFLLWFFLVELWLRSSGHLIRHRDANALSIFYKGIKDGLSLSRGE